MKQYLKVIDYIYNLNKYGIKLGLNNITYLLSLLGNPHLKMKIIHIAGTNGKGSTSAILSSILKNSRYKVGLYTSPHLVSFQERMMINGKMISRKDIIRLLEKMETAIQKVAITEGYQHPTFFEVITAMAFLYFYEKDVDFAVMEVGLGGRLDATNVAQSLISIITHIDFDHMDKLGNTLTEIAYEKASIIKKNTWVINAKQSKDANEEIKRMAIEKESTIYSFGQEIKAKLLTSSLEGNDFDYSGIYHHWKSLHVPLIGEYQLENASMAIAAAELIDHIGYPIHEQDIRRGLKNSRWPGRFEIIQERPTVILDGGHNPDGVQNFMKNLKRLFPEKRMIAVLGIFQDKDYPRIIQSIVPYVNQVVLTMAQHVRATPTHILAKEAEHYISAGQITEKSTVTAAIAEAFHIAKEDDVICITGSLYTVGEAEEYFLKRKKENKGHL
ncbi:MAG: bifunctional folylpolyglutamate synthase/dihydrofolate synthase [Candidatus Atribacteria bacterium]|nr:bifunctional folylpolyglutamate synthase/dihydrofolate synthase [Candidatus Atribacteria bacterium]